MRFSAWLFASLATPGIAIFAFGDGSNVPNIRSVDNPQVISDHDFEAWNGSPISWIGVWPLRMPLAKRSWENRIFSGTPEGLYLFFGFGNGAFTSNGRRLTD